MQRPGIPVCVITGFLGSGKTTLVNHILGNSAGLRAAVFINEFGSVEIDGSLIRWQSAVDETRIVTLDNGCICCEVNADLAGQLRRVLREQGEVLDVVVIETSGVCDPEPVLATLAQLDDDTHLDCVITVVDVTSYERIHGGKDSAYTVDGVERRRMDVVAAVGALGLGNTVRSQLRHSDIVLLNKCDLVGGANSESADRAEINLLEALRDARGTMMQSSRLSQVIRTERGNVDLALITGVIGGGRKTLQASNKAPSTLEGNLVGSPFSGTTDMSAKSSQCEPNSGCSPLVPEVVGGVVPSLDGPSPAKRPRSSVSNSDFASSSFRDGVQRRLVHVHGIHNLRAKARSFVYQTDRPFDPLKFEAWLEAAGPPAGVFRAKGLLWMHGIPRHVIFQLVGARTNPFETVRGGGQPVRSRIVFIGEASSLQAGDEIALTTALDACLC
eukprot:TRINITY_DN56593_c0_g1_i1.p1 TRINITY_DN56593_c0_g1~~TRINITY_DN56593_c0_g1_i1.p1  ORF type:complete len:443 (-),score=65.53 TRINITY_DN56593_c0_g1_i1:319-1647(-)